jgi:hypothetical protein
VAVRPAVELLAAVLPAAVRQVVPLQVERPPQVRSGLRLWQQRRAPTQPRALSRPPRHSVIT